ncbi:MAG TPA: DUF5615 family PIN-like protein [Tepidisphaeraceae bacterium]|jgi:predicted nuclease of predicted toxin-antitoxin system
MRLLADENIHVEIVQQLRALGHDVISALESFPGAPDQHVLQVARAQSRVLITDDKDFGGS